MARTYTAGIVTAYGAAKEAGYTGTYEEFCEQQAGFAGNAAQVAEDRAAVETIKNTFETVTVPAAVQTIQTEGAEQEAAVTAKGTEQVAAVRSAGDAQTGRVQMAGAEEVQDIETAGTTQVGAVNTAGATQVNAVNAAGTTQTGNVNDAGATQMAAIEAKGEETRESIPEDYSTLTAEVSDLKSSLNVMSYAATQFDVVSGTSHSANDDKMSISIKSGETYYCRLRHSLNATVSYQLWCYYTDGTNEKIASPETKYSYDFAFTPSKDVSAVGIYTISSTPTGTITVEIYAPDSVVLDDAEAKAVNVKADVLATDLYGAPVVVPKFRNGTVMNAGNASAVSILAGTVPVVAGDVAELIINRPLPEGHVYYIQYTVGRSSGAEITTDLGENVFVSSTMPTNAIWVGFNIFERSSAGGETVPLRVSDFASYDIAVKIHPRSGSIAADVSDTVKAVSASKNLIIYPVITNGSGGNPGNANAVTARAIPIINNAIMVSVKNAKPVKADGNYYRYTVSAFRGSSWYADKVSGVSADKYEEFVFNLKDVITGRTDVDGFGITVWEYDSSGNYVSDRFGDFDNYPLIIRYIYDDQVQNLVEINREETDHYAANARHVPGNTRNAVTLLHFSDIHADAAALARIIADAKKRTATIDDKICTGDIVANAYGEITSWWDASVMTCIGNHDTASYSNGTYDWTALSMANRDAYYIAPFESNWGITHTSGTSYYYKDYSSQKLRLIVMDSMLYNSGGAEATAQTAWLENLLSEAITNSLHVLIAIHAPHGGASAVDCSFSRYAQTVMPTHTDCNTPQVVIDTVAAKISAGLKFAGYIVGHTHQDNVWDATGDGKQLMYCITCAAVASKDQWKNSDQDRSSSEDAYNLITVDTANTLVKIVRCGGADIDDKMRARKAICFNYSTGTKAGELL